MGEIGEFFRNPEQLIKRARKERNIGKTVVYQLFVSLLSAICAAVLANLAASGIETVYLAAGTFLTVFVALALGGFALTLVMNILGGKGKYYEGLTAIVYASVAPSVGCVIGALLSYVPAGYMLGVIAVFLSMAIGYATLYRAVKEFFKTDMITTLIGVTVIAGATIVAVYFMVFSSIAFTLATKTQSTVPVITPIQST